MAAVVVFITRSGLADTLPSPEMPVSTITLKPGNVVKLDTKSGDRYFGRFVGTISDSIFLESDKHEPFLSVPAESVHRISVRRLSAGYGALVGAVAGGVVGALLVSEARKQQAPSEQWESGTIVAGGLLFGAAGALLGTAVGLTIPRWVDRYDDTRDATLLQIHGPPPPSPKPPEPAKPPRPPRETSNVVSLYAGPSHSFSDAYDGSFGMSLGYSRKVYGHLGLGADVGFVTVHEHYTYYDPFYGVEYPSTWANQIFYGSALARFALWDGDILPYLIGGAGIGHLNSPELHYTLGGGAGYRVISSVDLAAELRWQQLLGDSDLSLLFFRIGLTYSW